MIIYQCDIHDQEFEYGKEMACATCERILDRIKEQEEVHKRNTVHSSKGMIQDVYWPEGYDRRVYEHIDHKPINITSKRQLRDELKKRDLVEVGNTRGYGKSYEQRRKHKDYDE